MAGADIRRYSIDRHGTSLNAPLAVLAAALLAFADALLYPVLMLPVLLVQLTDNLTTVGFVVALTGGLWFIPQIIAAGVIQDRRRVKPVLLAGGMTRVAALGFFTSIGFRASEFTNQQLLRWFVLAIIISTIASAFSARPLTIMTGRAVASEQQRRVFGGRGVLGSLLAIIGGWVILSLFATDGPVFSPQSDPAGSRSGQRNCGRHLFCRTHPGTPPDAARCRSPTWRKHQRRGQDAR